MYSHGSSTAVKDWLRFLELEDFYESFIDNGYDDLETVKLIERDDLVAIGVKNLDQQNYLLKRCVIRDLFPNIKQNNRK